MVQKSTGRYAAFQVGTYPLSSHPWQEALAVETEAAEAFTGYGHLSEPTLRRTRFVSYNSCVQLMLLRIWSYLVFVTNGYTMLHLW